MARFLRGREKSRDDYPEVDMTPPRAPGAPTVEQPVTVQGRRRRRDEPVDNDDDDEEYYFDMEEDADMEDYIEERPQRRPQPASPVKERVWGEPAYEWQIRKRTSRKGGTKTIEKIEDSDPPDGDYIMENWFDLYGGGSYLIFKDRYKVDTIKIEGEPIYEEDIARERQKSRSDDELTVPTLLTMMMKRDERDIETLRDENRRLRDEAEKARREHFEARLSAVEHRDSSVESFMKEMVKYRKLTDMFGGKEDVWEKLLDNPAVNNAINTFVEKMSEVDFSQQPFAVPEPGAPRGTMPGPEQSGPPPIVTREQYIARIQEICMAQKVTMPNDAIARAVDMALTEEEDGDPNTNLQAAIGVLDRLLDARKALVHLKNNVIEGDSTDEEAAEFIMDRFPRYAEYLRENGYAEMRTFLEQFDDIPDVKPMVRYARLEDTQKHVESIVQIIREEYTTQEAEFADAQEPVPGQMPGMDIQESNE